MSWIDDVEQPPQAEQQNVQASVAEDSHLPQLASYEDFIPKSLAYRWLMSKIQDRNLLVCTEPNAKDNIGSQVLISLRTQEVRHKMSRRRPISESQITFNIPWDLKEFIEQLGLDSSSHDIFDKVMCLTGSWNMAQTSTVAEYIRQTWPTANYNIPALLLELVRCPMGQIVTCMSTS
jgi:hypothetical protein